MPELPDIVVYLEALDRRISGRRLNTIRVVSPAVLRTYEPPVHAVAGSVVVGLSRIGKRLVMETSGGLSVVIHLMIAGRLRWAPPGASIPKKVGLASFDFEEGSLILTEQGTHRRAGIWVVAGGVEELDRGGIEPLEASVEELAVALRAENHTVKRALTDPRLVSGIGNAYSDEILWEARMAPTTLTSKLSDGDVVKLHAAVIRTLTEWTERLRTEVGEGWPEKVTAFRPEMAVHGKFGKACPRCGSPVQRIVYAANETNYCATCQTGGKLLADRALSRLLGSDWPRTLEE